MTTLSKADTFYLLARLYDLPGIKFASRRLNFPSDALQAYENLPSGDRSYYKIVKVWVFPSGWGGMRPMEISELQKLRRDSHDEQLQLFPH